MKIHLPNSAYLGNIDSFIRGFDPANPEKLQITANRKWISVHPVVIAMVAALGLSVGSKNIICERFEAKSAHYFERMGLFRLLQIQHETVIAEREPAGRFIPLTIIKETTELTNFIRQMVPLLHVSPAQAESIKHIITELVRNVLEHSSSAHGAIVCAQYYKKSNSVRIGIVDTGRGIRDTIAMSHPVNSHERAIQLALMPGITGTTRQEGGTDYNAGAGLFLMKSIAAINKDHFMIYSGDTMYKLLSRTGSRIALHVDPFNDRHSRDNVLPVWGGTVVGIDLSLDQSQALTLILEYVADTYRQAMRERKKARIKKARFVD